MYNSSCFRFRIVLYVLNQILNIERFVFILFYFLFCDTVHMINRMSLSLFSSAPDLDDLGL